MDLAGCVQTASQAYDVPVSVIERVLKQKTGGASAGGVGPMNIPDAWLPILARIGFPPELVRTDPCKNILAGAWVIALNRMAPREAAAGPRPALASTASVAQRAGVVPACVTGAADFYHLPVPLLTAILATEGGHVGQVSWNKNGSYDMGPTQVNSSWLPTLARAGISREQVLNNGCLNVAVGAWILAQSMDGTTSANPAEYWRHIGNYNSHTPQFNVIYQQKVWAHLREANR